MTESLAAPAKINTCLFVGPVRAADGRHELVSVMEAVTLGDTLRLGPVPARDEVLCPGVDGPNLAAAAIAAFRARTGWDGPPVRVEIDKRIPVAAGMAGGSADAAAALRLVAGLAGVDDDDLLREIAAGLGADVPAQIRPGRYLATGAGEIVEALPAARPAPTVLVLPSRAALSTPAVYAEFDRLGLARTADDLAVRAAEVRAATRSEASLPAALVVNDLAAAARSLEPSIDAALAAVAEAGADHALVSGSGPTVLGLFGEAESARVAADALRGRHPDLTLTRPLASA